MIDKDNIISKVRKMMALADGNANENESQLALEKAHEFMKRHGIEMLELQGEDNLEIDAKVWESDLKSQIDTYSRVLASAVAALFDCQWWMWRPGARMKYKVKLCFAGEIVDVQMAVEIWPWLTKMAGKLARSSLGPGWSSSHRCFAEGFSCRVSQRVDEMVQRDLEEHQCAKDGDDAHKYGLVVVAKEDAIDNMLEDLGIKIKTKKSSWRGEYDHNATTLGAQAGDKVNLDFRKNITAKPEEVKLIT